MAVGPMIYGKNRGKEPSKWHPHHWQAGTGNRHIFFGYRPYRGGYVVCRVLEQEQYGVAMRTLTGNVRTGGREVQRLHSENACNRDT